MIFSFQGAPEVRAPVHQVWLRLLDPQAVAHSGPGVERVEVVDAHHFKVLTALRIGSFKIQFTMKVELFDLIRERELKMQAKGKATGSSVEVTSRIRLEELGPSLTRLHWEATTEMRGVVAAVGGSRLEGLARDLTARFRDRFVTGIEVPV